MLQSNPQRPWEQEIRLSKLKTKSSANLNSKVIQFMGSKYKIWSRRIFPELAQKVIEAKSMEEKMKQKQTQRFQNISIGAPKEEMEKNIYLKK